MEPVREPILRQVPITKLRPTQITVGIREVELKRQLWRKLPAKKRAEFLGKHMIPVIRGPKGRHFIIDHHHLARALHDEGAENVLVIVVANLSDLDRDAFWTVLDHRQWVHPYDAKGRRRTYEDIPQTVFDLTDDPFRSVAGALRRIGGFAKDTTPFSEFLWADFLRRRMKQTTIKKDFKAALKSAMKLAKGSEAKYLPGWCGPSDD